MASAATAIGRRAGRRRASSSTRSTPASAAVSRTSSAASCERWGRRFRCSASRTCRRSRRAPTRTSRSRSTSRAGGPGRRCGGWTSVAASTSWRGCSAGLTSPMACGPRLVRCWLDEPSAAPPDCRARRRRAKGRRRKRKAKAKAPGRSGGPKERPSVARKYLIETFGCQMNVHDSERMAGLLEQAGYEATDEAADADVVLINTCSVRERAEGQLYTRLGELRQLAAETGHDPIVAVAGCVAQQEGESIFKRSAGLHDVVVGTQQIRRLPLLVDQASALRGSRPARANAGQDALLALDPYDDVTWPLGVTRRADPVKAYVTI